MKLKKELGLNVTLRRDKQLCSSHTADEDKEVMSKRCIFNGTNLKYLTVCLFFVCFSNIMVSIICVEERSNIT